MPIRVLGGRSGRKLQVYIFKQNVFGPGVSPERYGEYIVLNVGVTGVVEEPALRALKKVFDLFPVDAEFRGSVNVGGPGFDFDDMDRMPPGGNNIHFEPAVTPVAVENVESVGHQPVCGQRFTFGTGSDMWHHTCKLT